MSSILVLTYGLLRAGEQCSHRGQRFAACLPLSRAAVMMEEPGILLNGFWITLYRLHNVVVS